MSKHIPGLLPKVILFHVDTFLHTSREQTVRYWTSVQKKNRRLLRTEYIKRVMRRIRERQRRRLIYFVMSSGLFLHGLNV